MRAPTPSPGPGPGGGPALIRGEVAHARSRPRAHAFRYAAFNLRIPLCRLDELEAAGIALNRRGLVSFHERDHGPRDGSPLLPWIRELLAREGIEAAGEVVLHTLPRMLGFVFNPISIWVCHGPSGAVRAVLCEVSNTFGEHHNYLLAHPDGRPLLSGQTVRARKCFHVSPFCAVAGYYTFRFAFGARRWLARIDYHDQEPDPLQEPSPLLQTRFGGVAEPLGTGAGWRLFFQYPMFTLFVVLRIHWQALRLALRHAPFHAKPAPPVTQTTR